MPLQRTTSTLFGRQARSFAIALNEHAAVGDAFGLGALFGPFERAGADVETDGELRASLGGEHRALALAAGVVEEDFALGVVGNPIALVLPRLLDSVIKAAVSPLIAHDLAVFLGSAVGIVETHFLELAGHECFDPFALAALIGASDRLAQRKATVHRDTCHDLPSVLEVSRGCLCRFLTGLTATVGGEY